MPENSGKLVEEDGVIRGKVYKGFVIEDIAVEGKVRNNSFANFEIHPFLLV